MSDQINHNIGDGNSNILKELSDIKTSLAVNTTETQFIKESVNEVKSDVKDMKKNYVNQEQHKVVVDAIDENKKKIEKTANLVSTNNILLGIGTFLLSVLAGMLIFHLFNMRI